MNLGNVYAQLHLFLVSLSTFGCQFLRKGELITPRYLPIQ